MLKSGVCNVKLSEYRFLFSTVNKQLNTPVIELLNEQEKESYLKLTNTKNRTKDLNFAFYLFYKIFGAYSVKTGHPVFLKKNWDPSFQKNFKKMVTDAFLEVYFGGNYHTQFITLVLSNPSTFPDSWRLQIQECTDLIFNKSHIPHEDKIIGSQLLDEPQLIVSIINGKFVRDLDWLKGEEILDNITREWESKIFNLKLKKTFTNEVNKKLTMPVL